MTEPPPRSPTAFVTDATSAAHREAHHPERPERLEAIVRHLERTGLRGRMVDLPAREATDEELLAVHTRAHLETVAAAGRAGASIDPDTYLTPDSPAIARRAVGGAIDATLAVLDGRARNAFVATRPPGHHATANRAMGFCIFNGIAAAAAAALARGLERIAILDWDVHHGNGTQAIFDADPRVCYASTHEYPFYPGSGHFTESGSAAARGTKINIPLPAGTGDRAITSAYRDVILPAVERFRPELILVSCGWDAHALDHLAMLEVTTAGYTTVARMAVDAAERLCGGRFVAVLEGGYDEHALAWCAGALCELLLGEDPTPDPQPVIAPPEPDVTPILDAVRAEIGLT